MWFHDHNLSYQQSHNRSCFVSEDKASGLPASVSWYTRNPLLLQSAHSTFFLPQPSLCLETVPVHWREGRCVTHDTSPQRLCSSLGLCIVSVLYPTREQYRSPENVIISPMFTAYCYKKEETLSCFKRLSISN